MILHFAFFACTVAGRLDQPSPTTQPAATPAPQLPSASLQLQNDEELQQAIQQAYRSGLPHRMLLATHIERILGETAVADPQVFKDGALAVIEESDFSDDLQRGELYLRLLQQPVVDDVLGARDNAAKLTIDGVHKDWPRDSIVDVPQSSKGSKSIHMRQFGAMRDESSLYLYWAIDQRMNESEKNPIFNLELRTLETRFDAPAYTISIAGDDVSIYDGQGSQIQASEAHDLQIAQGSRSLEVKIPIAMISNDLRSFAARSRITDRKSADTQEYTPWITCPTGPVTYPARVLIDLASKHPLPPEARMTLAVALEEGMLMSVSDSTLEDRIKLDAHSMARLVGEIEQRQMANNMTILEDMPITAQLAWACRYAGNHPIASQEEYEHRVVAPETLRDMYEYASLQGWLDEADSQKLQERIAEFFKREFKRFDFPDAGSSKQGAQYTDPRLGAYYGDGEEKLLSYRDVGVNQRWKLFESGKGLKGNARQQMEFQRLMGIAVGLPSLGAIQQFGSKQEPLTLVYDGSKRRWYPVGASSIDSSVGTGDVHLIWNKPWTRPERFERTGLDLMPGAYQYVLDSHVETHSPKRYTSLIGKGLANEQVQRALLQPLQMR